MLGDLISASIAVVANVVVATAHMAIAVFVCSALARTGQLRSNRLGLATALIFASGSLGYFGHFVFYATSQLQPGNGPAGTLPTAAVAGGSVALYSWPLAAIDTLTALVAVYYVVLRRRQRRLLGDADDAGAMGLFVDLNQREQQHQLEVQRTEAVRADQQKSHFLTSMSHEIRTPLNGVLGMAELLRESQLDERQHRFTQTLIDSGNHLMTIVDEILDLARIESGRFELHTENFDLRAILSGVGRLYGAQAAAKHTTVDVTVDPAIPPLVHGDAARLRQVVGNLVSNAIKFTDRGRITVVVGRSPSRETRVGLRFTVSDTGIGMSESALPTLFEPFVQANAAISGTYGGSGLGLTICRELVDLMDGEISVVSRPGEGTTFTFTIMLAPAMAPDDGEATDVASPAIDAVAAAATSTAAQPVRADGGSAEPPCDRPRGATERARVLVVEDNPVNQEITAETLRWLGFDADVAGNGATALDALDGDHYDAILMDCRMPVMDGYEATRRIRSRTDATAGIPIIAMTALIDNSDRTQCMDAGMSDFVRKPTPPAALASVLEAHGLAVDQAASAELDRQMAVRL